MYVVCVRRVGTGRCLPVTMLTLTMTTKYSDGGRTIVASNVSLAGLSAATIRKTSFCRCTYNK